MGISAITLPTKHSIEIAPMSMNDSQNLIALYFFAFSSALLAP